MKRFFLALLGIVCVLVAAAVVSSAIRDELNWRWVTYKDHLRNYKSYMVSWPDGRHIDEAKHLYDELSWSYAVEYGSVQSFETYLSNNPEGEHVSQASDRLDTLLWMQAEEENTPVSYQHYVGALPEGHFAKEASSRNSSLLRDEMPYLAAQKVGTRESFEKFIREFPGHQLESKAKGALEDMNGRDLVDLMSQKTVSAKIRGSGIKSVEIEMRRLVNHEVRVRIPVGTYFVCRGSAQNMVGTTATIFTLNKDSLHTVEVSAACANRSRNIPYDDDSFYIQRSANHGELDRLMPALNKANVRSDVEQAAIWIVTDNANYEDLGILIVGAFPTLQGWRGGTRAITEDDAARAMKICDEAGVDIVRKAIWRDRKKILKGLWNEQLKKWLKEKTGT